MSANETRGWTKGPHSPLPWALPEMSTSSIVDATGEGVVHHGRGGNVRSFIEQGDANIALIVRAVNSHKELVEALEAALKMCESYESLELEPSDNGVHPVCAAARAALAKARGSK